LIKNENMIIINPKDIKLNAVFYFDQTIGDIMIYDNTIIVNTKDRFFYMKKNENVVSDLFYLFIDWDNSIKFSR
jgi:serine phosphatase RsbU (regulator of sigma subunit)